MSELESYRKAMQEKERVARLNEVEQRERERLMQESAKAADISAATISAGPDSVGLALKYLHGAAALQPGRASALTGELALAIGCALETAAARGEAMRRAYEVAVGVLADMENDDGRVPPTIWQRRNDLVGKV